MRFSEELFVTFTMDCERIKKYSPPGGPESWELSERAIEGFSEVLSRHNLLGTFFIVPETARKHKELFLELEERGFELGMHLHPQSFRDLSYDEYLGAYSYEDQEEILSLAKSDWADALGREPITFRSGNFSANDSTFRVLYELGFRQGSVSVPEREMPRFRAVWRGTDADAHHTHPAFRLIPGNLDFYEIPITVDPDRRFWDGGSAFEFRIEFGSADEHLSTVSKRIDDLVKRDVAVKTLVSITHNTFDYGDKSDPRREALEVVADKIWEVGDKFGLIVIPATIAQIHEVADGGCHPLNLSNSRASCYGQI